MEYSRAAAAGWGGIDLFTDGVFPESCTFYLPADRLHTVDTTFDFDAWAPRRPACQDRPLGPVLYDRRSLG